MTQEVDGHSDPWTQSVARPTPPPQEATIFGGKINNTFKILFVM